MENKEVVSIVIPIYNVEAYLKQCLETIVNQTYPNLEIILVNDGSPDKSEEICKE
ncbi:MAG: glycosyltransferase family 2 protein, partial [Streptococcus sp.]|nr:glycosyltransferase family 2 protein [Streptococcus sp.]